MCCNETNNVMTSLGDFCYVSILTLVPPYLERFVSHMGASLEGGSIGSAELVRSPVEHS